MTERHDWIMAEAERLQALGETEPRPARDPVNQPMVNNWLEALGETDERFTRGEAPPAMAQVWTMYGLDPTRPDGDPLHGAMQVLDRAGYTSVLGTNCDQVYERYLRVGEEVSITTRLESVVGPKQTGVGEGYFVTTVNSWWVGSELVATMSFRVLKFIPRPKPPDRSAVTRPMRNRDTEFFWEGAAKQELRIQSCNACGLLRHPPGPMCPSCHACDRGYVVASGRGTVFSFLVHHAPRLPGRELPLTLALVELEEGVRMVATVPDPPEDVAIGDPVEVRWDRLDDETTPADVGGRAMTTVAVGTELPAWELPVTPTLVVSTALATRDFQDVHHDRDLAQGHGSQDIFLNILTTTGLVQRYVGEWARPTIGDGFVIRSCALRLGAPAYPYDTVRFTASVTAVDDRTVSLSVVGEVLSSGATNGMHHVDASVVLVP